MEFLTHSTDEQGLGESGRKGLFQRACAPIPPTAALLGALLLLTLVFFHAFGNGKNGLAAAGAAGADAGAVDTGPFASLTLEAQSAYVYDLATETVLFERYPERRMALASLAKLMTALAARRLLDQDAQMRISAHAIAAQGDDGLLVGERFRTEDVLDIMLIRSSNDAALALAEAGARILGEFPAGAAAAASTTQPHTSAGREEADSDATMPFVHFMNAEAQRLGLRETEFFNSTGLDVSEDLSGAYGSAKDVVALAAAFLREAPEQFGATRRTALSLTSIDGFLHKLKNTNDLLHDIPGLIAAKTGFTDLAGGNLLVLFDLGVQHPIAAVVLGSTEQGRFTDMLQLINATYAGRP
jgi:serine-type D-Ala-D-Ala carboxypeptidase (penicillin-binding protein 5/6)